MRRPFKVCRPRLRSNGRMPSSSRPTRDYPFKYLYPVRRMTRGAMISIALLALIALLLIMLLGRHGVAGTVDTGESKTQTNEINVARECATTCSSVRQCHLDPGCREKAITCQLYRLGHGGQPPMICRNVQKCKERCVELKPAPGLTGPVP